MKSSALRIHMERERSPNTRKRLQNEKDYKTVPCIDGDTDSCSRTIICHLKRTGQSPCVISRLYVRTLVLYRCRSCKSANCPHPQNRLRSRKETTPLPSSPFLSIDASKIHRAETGKQRKACAQKGFHTTKCRECRRWA